MSQWSEPQTPSQESVSRGHLAALQGGVSAAARIVRELGDRALHCRDGSVTWRVVPEEPSRGEALLGPHLYDGSPGVALFLGAFHEVTRDAEARDLALRAIAPLRAKVAQLVAEPERARRLAIPVGGLIGLGSYIYVFLRLARWLGEPGLLDAASEVVALITRERIASDRRFDVSSGCAGTLLALLALEHEEPAAGALEVARLCGCHLLEHRIAYRDLPRAWATPDHPPLSGFAHGASGIACALLRLDELGLGEFRAAALEAFAYERALYDPESRSWLDPRFERPLEQAAWCHGPPGMALARAVGLGGAAAGPDCSDLEECLELTSALPESPLDHVCCGNLGRADILWTTGCSLSRPQLLDQASELAARVLARAEADGFSVAPDEAERTVPASFRPSFFRGLAGIGYTLLRLVNPHRLPCVLVLE